MSDKLSVIHSVLADTDLSLRKRLHEIGVDLPHMFVAIGPSGDIVIQGELGARDLQRLAKAIDELAEKQIWVVRRADGCFLQVSRVDAVAALREW